jgi:hypothetical protein
VPGHFASWPDFEAAQDTIDGVGAQILTASMTIPGYAGIVVSAENNTLDLYWHGGLPDPIARIVKGSPVPVTVHGADYAEADLQAQVARITELPGVNQAGPKVDGSGLSVKVGRDTPQSTVDALGKMLSVPYELGSKEVSNFDSFNKTNDIAPYWGGSRIVWQLDGGMCSAGFAVQGIFTGQQTMLTAGHCRPWGNTFDNFTDGGGDVMGFTTNQQHFRDTVLIVTKVQGDIYTGNFDSFTFTPVRGAYPSFPGDVVCRSSAFSNQMCGIQVVDIGQSVKAKDNEGTWTVSPMVEAKQPNGLPAAGNGDSGGAVFSGVADGGVTARGTYSADDGKTVPCTGVPSQKNRSCTTGMFYADIFFTLALSSSVVVTG